VENDKGELREGMSGKW